MPGLNPAYSFFLANSNDLSNIGELDQARERQFSIQLNRSGSASFSYPMDDPMAEFINPVSSAVKIYRKSPNSAVRRCVWSGYVNAITEDVGNNKMTINCVGWFERLMHRYTRRKIVWTNKNDLTIIADLIGEANNVAPPNPYGSSSFTVPVVSGSIPLTPTLTQFIGSSEGQRLTPNVINKTIEKDVSFGQAILDLTEIENGCDFVLDPATRNITLYGKNATDKTSDAVFGFNWGPSNVNQFTRTLDASGMANYLLVRNGVNAPALTENISSQNQYGLFEEVQNNSAFLTTETMLYYANAELPFKEFPRISYSVVPFPYTSGSSVPEPFEDYDIGDIVNFTAIKPPRINTTQDCRVFGMSINITEEGNEILGPLQIYHTN